MRPIYMCKQAGSAIAAVSFRKNMLSVWSPVAAKRMYTVLGFQRPSILLGLVDLALNLAPIMLLWKGKEKRGRSKQGLLTDFDIVF